MANRSLVPDGYSLSPALVCDSAGGGDRMADRQLPSYDVTELIGFSGRSDGSMEVVPRYTGPLEAPNAWWAEWDKALAYALSQGWEPRRAEDFANEMAERAHPGGRRL